MLGHIGRCAKPQPHGGGQTWACGKGRPSPGYFQILELLLETISYLLPQKSMSQGSWTDHVQVS
jgi:hypothetical protein